MKFRIVTRKFTDGDWSNQYTEVFDAETGKKIENVTAVRFEHADARDVPKLSLTLIPEEVTIEGECDLYPFPQ